MKSTSLKVNLDLFNRQKISKNQNLNEWVKRSTKWVNFYRSVGNTWPAQVKSDLLFAESNIISANWCLYYSSSNHNSLKIISYRSYQISVILRLKYSNYWFLEKIALLWHNFNSSNRYQISLNQRCFQWEKQTDHKNAWIFTVLLATLDLVTRNTNLPKSITAH